MRIGLLTLLCCALVTALPREDSLKEWDGGYKGPHGGSVHAVKAIDGGTGGGIGVGIGDGGGGGSGCDPVACDINVSCICGYP